MMIQRSRPPLRYPVNWPLILGLVFCLSVWATLIRMVSQWLTQ